MTTLAQLNANRVTMTARLKSVKHFPEPNSTFISMGKYRFEIEDRQTGADWKFQLIAMKALKLADDECEFPKGVMLRLSGLPSKKNPGSLLHVKIIAVDGHDVESWAQLRNSPTVSPEVQKKARGRVKKARKDAEEAAMRDRAPPDGPPRFTTAKDAYARAMHIVHRQTKLKEPKLTKTEVWTLRDALNFLKEAAGV